MLVASSSSSSFPALPCGYRVHEHSLFCHLDTVTLFRQKKPLSVASARGAWLCVSCLKPALAESTQRAPGGVALRETLQVEGGD